MSTLGGKVSIRRPTHRMREVLCWRLRLENSRIAPREDNELWAPPSSSLEMESEGEKRPSAAFYFVCQCGQIGQRISKTSQGPTVVNVLFHLGHFMHTLEIYVFKLTFQ